MRVVEVRNQTRGTVLASRVEVADTIRTRMVGLLGRATLEPGTGMWIVPSNSIHTFGMKFAFDLILLNKDLQVVSMREGIRPFSLTFPNFQVKSVLELPLRTIAQSRTEIGDQLTFSTL